MKRKNKKLIIALLSLVVVGMGVGYSILSKQLKIEGSVSVDAEYDVSIVGIEKLEYPDIFRNVATYGIGLPKGTVTENANPTFTSNTAVFDVTLGLNSSIAYLVKIKNTGTVDAVIENVDIAKTGNGIKVQTNINDIDDAIDGEALLVGETLNYIVNISNDRSEELDFNLKSNITITFNTKQKLTSENYSCSKAYLSFGDNVIEDGKITGVKLNYLPSYEKINYIQQVLYASVDGGEYEEVGLFDGNLEEIDIVYNLPDGYEGTDLSEHTVKLRMGYPDSDQISTNEITLVY